MSSFAFMPPTPGDPPLGVYELTIQLRNLNRGLIPETGEPFIDPTTDLPELFPLSGDPA